MSDLYAAVALAFCTFLTMALRALIVGERFDRALHRVDPTYRNMREITRGVLVEPIEGVRGFPRAYGRYNGVIFRPVGNPEVERLRRRAVRALVEFAILGMGGVVAVFVLAAPLRRISAGFHDIAVLSAIVLFGLYWIRRLAEELRDPDRSTMAALYMIGGIATALGGIVFVVAFSSRVA
jgi:hypothetical protein